MLGSMFSEAISCQELGLAGVGRQAMIEARHAELGRDPALALHVDLARGIVADQHGGKAGAEPLGGNQFAHALGHAFTQAERDRPCRRSAWRQPCARIHSPMRVARFAGSPFTLRVLSRAEAPLMTEKADLGRRHSCESKAITASLALPSSGGAVTEALSALVCRLERSAPRPRLDAKLDRHAVHAAPEKRRIAQCGQYSISKAAQEEQAEQQDDRRDIDAAEIGQHAADRPQDRLGDAVEEIDHPSNELVTRVDARRTRPASS